MDLTLDLFCWNLRVTSELAVDQCGEHGDIIVFGCRAIFVSTWESLLLHAVIILGSLLRGACKKLMDIVRIILHDNRLLGSFWNSLAVAMGSL